MPTKWSLNRTLEGTKKCPRLRLDQKLPTSTKPHYLHSFQRFSSLRNHRFSIIFDSQNDAKINKTSVPSKYHPKYTPFPLIGPGSEGPGLNRPRFRRSSAESAPVQKVQKVLNQPRFGISLRIRPRFGRRELNRPRFRKRELNRPR